MENRITANCEQRIYAHVTAKSATFGFSTTFYSASDFWTQSDYSLDAEILLSDLGLLFFTTIIHYGDQPLMECGGMTPLLECDSTMPF